MSIHYPQHMFLWRNKKHITWLTTSYQEQCVRQKQLNHINPVHLVVIFFSYFFTKHVVQREDNYQYFLLEKQDMCPEYRRPPLFGFCPYGNNIWMHKFQQLENYFSNAQSDLLYILTLSPISGHEPGVTLAPN